MGYDEGFEFVDDDEGDDDPICVLCTKVIGSETGYGDDWGEGPICSDCIESLESE